MPLRTFLPALLAAATLGAQVPDPAFFKGDPQQIMLACAERARSLKPHKDIVLAQTGRAYLVAGKTAEAESAFQLAGRGDAAACRWIGQAWIEAGDAKRAMAAFSRITELDRWAKNETCDAAVRMMDGGDAKDATSLMAIAYKIGPSDWQNANAFARACLRQQRPDLAAEWFAKAVAGNRKENDFWMDVAHSFANHGAEE